MFGKERCGISLEDRKRSWVGHLSRFVPLRSSSWRFFSHVRCCPGDVEHPTNDDAIGVLLMLTGPCEAAVTN
jgi:hypothetical protein